ncbi:MAG: hypothetical protein IJ455_02075 [Agathobacter sp.]|nr:hypothetical protein [Agathobacter sp.]
MSKKAQNVELQTEKEEKRIAKKEKKQQIKETSKRQLRWDKLDNTALIFPVIAGEGMTNTYRISVELNEEIQPELLQQALDIVLPKFNVFNVRLRMGVFWYFFEENNKPAPRVKEEELFPCRYIQPNKNNSYLFNVSYYKRRINLEVFHVLTDGMGGMTFAKELVYQYLRLAHPELRSQVDDKLSDTTSLNTEDSFEKNYKKKSKRGYTTGKAYLIKLKKLAKGEFGVMHGLINIPELKAVTKKYGVSINEYLVAVFAWATYVQCLHKAPSKYPIRIAVPVNLRPYFNSNTLKNFFTMVSAEFHPTEEEYTFEDVLAIIQKSLKSQIQKENLEELFSVSVSNQKNKLLRMVPLVIKNLVMRLVFNRSAVAHTTTITNVGFVKLDPIYEPYVKMFRSFIAMSKGQSLKGTVNSYQDTLVFTFSSIFSDTSVQKEFFRKIAEDGVTVQIETNGVYYE